MTDVLDDDQDDQVQALADTNAWDEIYARATRRARATGFAQLILERGSGDYRLIDGRKPDALRVRRLRGAKIHVILDWG